jgi:hypothetical protein
MKNENMTDDDSSKFEVDIRQINISKCKTDGENFSYQTKFDFCNE